MLIEPYKNKKLLYLDKIKNELFNNFLDYKLHHSLLFVGEKGIGKSTLCYHLANKILDNSSTIKSNEPVSLFGDIEVVDENELSEKNPTFNLIINKKHPDLLVIEKEKDEKTNKADKEIKVASARKINDFITLAPFASSSKVIIIDSIDEMNTSAQNAILKVLEEPLKNTYIFLVCHNINKILDTIRSRCREININKYNFEEWKEILLYVYNEKVKLLNDEQLLNLFDLSNGSISYAIDIIDEDGIFLYNNIESILAQKNLNIEEVQNLAEKLNNNETLYNLFQEFILLFLYKCLKYYSNGESKNNFKENNTQFLLKNNEKKLLDKIAFTKNVFFDTNTYNLSKKHAIIVLFNNIFN